MTKNLHITALGSVSHGNFVTSLVAHTDAAVHIVSSVWDALSLIREKLCHILCVELPVEEMDEQDLLEAVAQCGPDCLTIFRIPSARMVDISALMRRGAYSFLSDTLSAVENRAVADQAVCEAESRRSARIVHGEGWRSMLVGASPEMQDVAHLIQMVALRRCTVLISGETGTGKEMCAGAIHAASDRSQRPMVALNCSAIPEHLLEAELFGHTRGAFTGAINERIGRFEEADHSTLFLDEIGDMPYDLQAKLLRVLQEREIQRLGSSRTTKVDVRIIAASNLDLLERVKQGRFREDLYYRLNVVPIKMPALRERRSDIALLARHFIRKICRLEDIAEKEIYNETLAKLASYDWPGNVRQLENMIERAVVISGPRPFLAPGDFPLETALSRPSASEPRPRSFSVPDHGIDFTEIVTTFERNLLDQALDKAKGNKTVAADLLGLKRSTLISKLRVMEQFAAA